MEERSKFEAQKPEMFWKNNRGITSSDERSAGRGQGP